MKSEVITHLERSVLGGMLRFNDVIGDVVTILTPGDFWNAQHQAVYVAILALWNSNRPVDLVSVADELARHGGIGPGKDVGYDQLAALWDCEPTSTKAVYHARSLRKLAVARRLHHEAGLIFEASRDPVGPVEELLDDAARRILAVCESLKTADGPVTAAKAVGEAMDAYDRRHATGFSGVSTGFLDLDEITTRMREGELIILAARTSVGKTTLALQIARHAAEEAGGVYLASLEMGRAEIGGRLLCSEGRIDSHRWSRGSLTEEQMNTAHTARSRLAAVPLVIDDANANLLHMASEARRMKRQGGLLLVVVDYLQLVPMEHRQRYEELGLITRQLKALARELSCPVLALAQLSRAAETADKPLLSHLRESGNLEQDADAVWLMYPEKVEGAGANSSNVVNLDVAKNRNGRKGSLKLVFVPQHCRFENYAGGVPFGD